MSRIASSNSDTTESPQASHGALGRSHEIPLRLHELQCNFQRLQLQDVNLASHCVPAFAKDAVYDIFDVYAARFEAPTIGASVRVAGVGAERFAARLVGRWA